MYGCLPPPKGPSKPNVFSLPASSDQETGGILCVDTLLHPGDFFDGAVVNRGNREAAAEPDDKPAIDHFYEAAAAFFEGFSRCPDPGKGRDLAVIRLFVIDLFVPGVGRERFRYIAGSCRNTLQRDIVRGGSRGVRM